MRSGDARKGALLLLSGAWKREKRRKALSDRPARTTRVAEGRQNRLAEPAKRRELAIISRWVLRAITWIGLDGQPGSLPVPKARNAVQNYTNASTTANTTAGSMLAVLNVFSQMRFTPTQKIRIEPTSETVSYTHLTLPTIEPV